MILTWFFQKNKLQLCKIYHFWKFWKILKSILIWLIDFDNIFLIMLNKSNCCRTEKQLYYVKILQLNRQEKIIQKNINSQYQWTWKRNVWIHSKKIWCFQLFWLSESQSMILCWFECIKTTQIWCHDLLHAKWSWWSVKSHSERKSTENAAHFLSQQAFYRCWDSILIYEIENSLFNLNYQKNSSYDK